MADPFVALASGADASSRETLPLLSEYGYDFEKHRFRYDENGNNITVTEDEALKVWIYKALMTERYRYLPTMMNTALPLNLSGNDAQQRLYSRPDLPEYPGGAGRQSLYSHGSTG